MVHLKLKKELKPERINLIEWTRDVLPELQETYDLVKRVFWQRARQAWFSKFSTPIIEKAELFERWLWFSTDILSKNELYKFEANWEELALRPELTLWMCRAYIENLLSQEPQPLMFYSFDKVFRNVEIKEWEKKVREFNQFWMEVFWEVDPWIDAQLIHLWWQVLWDLKVRDWAKLKINSVWSHKTRKKFNRFSTDYFEWKRKVLCPDCQKRIEENPWRIHKCKEEDCKIICSKAPKIKDFWMDDDKKFHEEVLELLDATSIPYEVDERLTVDQDYYSRTVFEVTDEMWVKMLWWWRYDLLMTHLWWEDIPWAWFAINIETIIDKMVKIWVQTPIKNKIDVFVGQLWKSAKIKVFPLIEKLQNLWIRTMWWVGQPSIKWQMAMAEKSNAKFALIMWTLEVRDNVVILRDMQKWVQEPLPFDTIIDVLVEKLWKENLDNNKFIDEIYIETPKEETEEEKFRKKKRSRFNW
jgi:histidyl-tRNA synthetase